MGNRSGRRIVRSNLVWVCGIAAGLVVGGVVAYGLTSDGPTAVGAHPQRDLDP